MSVGREWMYTRLNDDEKGTINNDFVDEVDSFIAYACKQLGTYDVTELRCLCKKCHNRKFLKLDDVRVHLFRKRFVPEYYVCNRHGEPYESMHSEQSTCHLTRAVDVEPTNPYRQMILDAIGLEFENDFMEEAPNLNAKNFYDLLNTVYEKLWDGCTTHSQMSAVARLLHMKSEHHFLERCYDDFIRLLREVLPYDNKMVDNFYRTNKLVQGLGLPI